MRNLVSFAYTYDNADQRTSVTREDGRVINYGYDAIGQLTNASGGVYQYGYQYDETGNPVLQNKGGFIVSNTFNHLNQNVESEFSGGLSVWGAKQGPLPATVSENSVTAQPWGLTGWNASGLSFMQGTNRLTTIIEDIAERITTNLSHTVVQDKIYTHDLNGNMTRNGDFEYIWDDENRLIAVKKADLLIQQNRYDGLSRRIEKVEYYTDELIVNRYVYAGWTVICMKNDDDDVLEKYVHGLDIFGALNEERASVGGTLAVLVNEGPYFYHSDVNANVNLITGENGIIHGRLEYSPFGEVLLVYGNYRPLYQFSGKEWDALTLMNYYGHRYYEAGFGRWLTRDPIGENGGINLYQFLLNNPFSGVDQLGLYISDIREASPWPPVDDYPPIPGNSSCLCEWDWNPVTAINIVLKDETYPVECTDKNGCKYTATERLEVVQKGDRYTGTTKQNIYVGAPCLTIGEKCTNIRNPRVDVIRSGGCRKK